MMTAQQRFIVFRQAVWHWIEILGLKSHELRIVYNAPWAESGDLAALRSNRTSRTATITLTKIGAKSRESMHDLALHEALELLLADFYDLSEYRYATRKELDIERHKIIARLSCALRKESRK
ncbi:MAG: hypothetical protein ABIH23_08285 [bacterium]